MLHIERNDLIQSNNGKESNQHCFSEHLICISLQVENEILKKQNVLYFV
jgi:hypothetical protein